MGADNLSRFWSSINLPSDENAWPPSGSIVIWPSYFCFAVAIISVVFGTIVLGAYYWGIEAANKWNDRHGWFTTGAIIGKLGLLAAVAGSMYSTSSPSIRSVWGISCNTAPANVTQKLVNFGSFCSMQVLLFHSSITDEDRN